MALSEMISIAEEWIRRQEGHKVSLASHLVEVLTGELVLYLGGARQGDGGQILSLDIMAV